MTVKLTDVEKLMKEALSNVTPSNWANAMKHTEKVEEAFRKTDFPNQGADSKGCYYFRGRNFRGH